MLSGSAEQLDGERGLHRAVHDRRAQAAAGLEAEDAEVG